MPNSNSQIRQSNPDGREGNRRDSMLRSSAIRQMREEAKSSANQNIEEIFKCFICYGKIQDAVLCPSCSKLCECGDEIRLTCFWDLMSCCGSCLRACSTWENQQQLQGANVFVADRRCVFLHISLVVIECQYCSIQYLIIVVR